MEMPVIAVCCVCKAVREQEESIQGDTWMPLDMYLDRHDLRETNFQMAYTYCPDHDPSTPSSARAVRYPDEPQTLRGKILRAAAEEPGIDLERLLSVCGSHTWNEVFMEVDRLTRSGELRLDLVQTGVYQLSLPQGKELVAYGK